MVVKKGEVTTTSDNELRNIESSSLYPTQSSTARWYHKEEKSNIWLGLRDYSNAKSNNEILYGENALFSPSGTNFCATCFKGLRVYIRTGFHQNREAKQFTAILSSGKCFNSYSPHAILTGDIVRHSVQSRSNLDPGQGLYYMDTSLAVGKDGVIEAWRVFVKRKANQYQQVYIFHWLLAAILVGIDFLFALQKRDMLR
jgi:hypothetical protein